MIKYFSILLLILNILLNNKFQNSGRIFDSKNNEPLIGANVIIENTSLGSASDIDGNFIIKNITQEKNFIKVDNKDRKPKCDRNDSKKTFISSGSNTSGRVNFITGKGKRKKYLGVVVK